MDWILASESWRLPRRRQDDADVADRLPGRRDQQGAGDLRVAGAVQEGVASKSVARFSKLQYRHILRGRLKSDDPQDLQKLLEAATKFASFAQHLTIIEGDDTTTTDKIQEVAAAKAAKAGAKRCVVLVDYLQVLPVRAQDGSRATNTKDRVDLHVSTLRRMARKLDSPVLAISSENRAAYRNAKTLDVFKESGGIEYSADVAMVLTRDKKNKPSPDSEYRPLDLNIIENRNGELGVVKLKFYPKCAVRGNG